MRNDETLRGWPLPYKTNTLAHDVERLRESLIMIDAELTKIEGSIDTKLNALETKIKQNDITEKLGFYIDDEGYLAQKINTGDTPKQDGDDETQNPVVLIDGEPAKLATQADIQELLRELNLGQ